MFLVAFATDDVIKLLVKSFCETAPKLLFWALACVPVFDTRYVWLVVKAFFDLPISLIRNSKRVSVNSLSSLGAQNKYFGATLRTLLTKGQFNKACNLQV